MWVAIAMATAGGSRTEETTMASDQENNGSGDVFRPFVPPVVEQQEEPSGDGETTAAQQVPGGPEGPGDQEDSSPVSSVPPEADEQKESAGTASGTAERSPTSEKPPAPDDQPGGDGGSRAGSSQEIPATGSSSGSSLELLKELLGAEQFADLDMELSGGGTRTADGGTRSRDQLPDEIWALLQPGGIELDPNIEEILRPHYEVHVDVDSVDGTTRPLTGVNKGPRRTWGAGDVPPDYPFDLTQLYRTFGITSVRTHEGGYNVSNLFRVPDSPDWSPAQIEVGVRNQVGDILTWDWEDWLEAILREDGDLKGGYIYLNPGHDRAAEFGLEESYLYWYPNLISHPSYWWGEQYQNYLSTGVAASFIALAEGELEIYFRLGEGAYGPTYVGHPDGDDIGQAVNAKQGYAWVAAQIVADLSSMGNSPKLPEYIEFWNETYLGPDKHNIVARATEFVELFRYIEDAADQTLPQPIPIGGFAFLSGRIKEFAYSSGNVLDSLVYQVLFRLGEEGAEFISFHWYGTPQTDHPRDNVFDLVEDLVHLDHAMMQFYATNADFPPPGQFHLSEWALWPSHDTDDLEDAGRNPLRERFGAAYASAVLSWLQQPLPHLPIERAHHWLGRAPSTGLFRGARTSAAQGDEYIDTLFVRTAAGAFVLHADLADMDLAHVEITETTPLSLTQPVGWTPGPHSVLDAAQNRMWVTALAVNRGEDQGPFEHSVVVTSLIDQMVRVKLEVRGLVPNAQYVGRTRTITEAAEVVHVYDNVVSFGEDTIQGIAVNSTAETTVGDDGVVVTTRAFASEADATAALDALVDVTWWSRDADGGGNLTIPLVFDTNGVKRVDLMNAENLGGIGGIDAP